MADNLAKKTLNTVVALKEFDKNGEKIEYLQIVADVNGIEIPLIPSDKTAKSILLNFLKSNKGGNA